MSEFAIEEWPQLQPQVRTLWRYETLIAGGFTALFVGIIEWFVLKQIPNYPLPRGIIALTLFLIIVGPGLALVNKKYEMHRFRLGQDDLAVAAGVFWREMRFVSRARIQHVDISAGPIARSLGLVNVSVHVGGVSHAALTIPGLAPHQAESLKQVLIGDRPNPSAQ